MIKKCITCKTEKSISEFYKHKQMKDGFLNECKECVRLRVKNNPKTSSKHPESYDKTEKGVIRVLFKSMKRRSKLRKFDFDLKKEDFIEWLYKNNYKEMYEKWANSGYKKPLKPSVDRIDDFNGYAFDNMQLITDSENRKKQYDDIINGRSTSGKRCKPVICFDKNGVKIAEYVSFNSAKRSVGYSMEKSIKTGKPDIKNGFYWKYK